MITIRLVKKKKKTISLMTLAHEATNRTFQLETMIFKLH